MSKSNAWIVDGMISGEGWKVLYVLNVRLIYIYIYLFIYTYCINIYYQRYLNTLMGRFWSTWGEKKHEDGVKGKIQSSMHRKYLYFYLTLTCKSASVVKNPIIREPKIRAWHQILHTFWGRTVVFNSLPYLHTFYGEEIAYHFHLKKRYVYTYIYVCDVCIYKY